MANDPVCGMEVDEKKAAATAAHEGKTYFFCDASCKLTFLKDPEKYVPASGGGRAQAVPPQAAATSRPGPAQATDSCGAGRT